MVGRRVRSVQLRGLGSGLVPACLAAAASLLALPGAAQVRSYAAAEMLTLDNAIASAVASNPRLSNASLDVQKASDGVEAARTLRYPQMQLDVLGSHNLTSQSYTFDQGIFGTYPIIGPIPATSTTIESQSGFSTIVSASVSQPLSQLYKLNLNVEGHQIEQSMAEEQLRARRHSLVKDVKQQYFDILKTESSLAATEEAIAFYRELSALVDRYVKERVALEYQSLEARTRLARSEHKARTERNAMQTQKERLNNLMGRDVRTPFSVTGVASFDGPVPDATRAGEIALASRPEVAQALLKLQHAEVGYEIKRADYIPDLSLVMRYSRLGNVSFIPSEVWTVGLEFRWEFYDWGRKDAQLGQRNADVQQARNDIRLARSQVLVEVDADLRKLEDARSYINVAEMGQAASREKLRVLMNQYRERAVLLSDVMQAESELADANSEYQKALLAVLSARAALDKTLGVD